MSSSSREGVGRSAVRLLLVGVVVVATLSTPIAAQRPAPDRVVLTNHEQIETVTLDGDEYAIYAYDSPLPYVGGITVYRDGEPVRSKETVESVLTAHARREALARLKADELETIRRFGRNAEAIQKRLGPTVAAINDTLAYRETLKNTTVDNRTAWKAALEASPAFEETFTSQFGMGPSALAELRNQLQELNRSAAEVDRHATAVVDIVEKRRNGTEIDKSRLFAHYTELLSAVERTATLSDQLDGRLSTVADRTGTIATQTSDIPKVADEIATRMERLRSALGSASERLSTAKAKLRNDRKALNEVDRRAATIEQRLLARWESGGSIKAKVYGSLGEGVLAVLAAALAVVRVRRE